MCFCLLPVTGSRFEFGFAKEGQLDNLRNQLCFCLGFCASSTGISKWQVVALHLVKPASRLGLSSLRMKFQPGGDRIGLVSMTVSNIYTIDNLIFVLKQRYNVIKLALPYLCNYTMRKQFSPFVVQFRLNDCQSF